jgi:hypothetical protein
MSTDPLLEVMAETMKRADQLVDDMHDALAKANDVLDLHPIRIRDGIPVLDQPVIGNVYVTANSTTTIVAVFNRSPADAWWTPFLWTDAYGQRDEIPFGCGSITMYHQGGPIRRDAVLRIHLRHKLMKGWESIALALKQVLSREQFLELADICDSPEDATTWGPWMTAIETGA